MKFKLILPFLILFFILNQEITAQFGSRMIIDSNTLGISDITIGDINNDGLQDIVIAQKYNFDQIGYYPNQGNGNFGSLQTILNNINNPLTIVTGDFNNDNQTDVLTGASSFVNNQNFIYYITNDINNQFVTTVLDTLDEIIIKIKPVDINNDGNLDFVCITDTHLIIYYNNGQAQFTKSIVSGITTEYYDFTLGDINGDGLTDIITASFQTLVFINNNGIIQFDSTLSNSVQSIGLISKVLLNDFDNDGDPDLLLTDQNGAVLKWFENTSSGFVFRQVLKNNIIGTFSLTSADFDLDGDIDIVSIDSQSGKLEIYNNTGQGNFDSPQVIFTGNSPMTIVVYSSDINSDNRPDIIWGEELSIHLNENALSVEENFLQKEFKVFPNPLSENNLNILANQDGSLSIFDMFGNKIHKEIYLKKGNNHLNISLPPQLYLLLIKNKNGYFVSKLMVR